MIKHSKLKRFVKKVDEADKLKRDSAFFRGILKQIIDAELSVLEVCDEYDNPNWAYLQAEVNGKRKAFNTVLSILEDLD